MSIDASHILVFQLKDAERLVQLFGMAAVRAGLADVAVALNTHADTLLAGRRKVALPPSATPTRWWRGFAMTEGSTGAEALAEAISAAGHKVLVDVFGGSTGGRLSFSAGALGLPTPLPADIDTWLDQAWQEQVHHRATLAPDAPAALRAVIAGQGLRTLFQPIVSLPAGQVVGYEALSRGPEGSTLETANALFGAGERFNLSLELELACARQAAKLALGLPEGRWLSINLGLEALSTPGVVEALARPGIILEITEHLPLDQAEAHGAFFEKARSLGARIALDDTGCGFANMAAVRSIRPEIVKLCITVTRNADRSFAHLAEISRTVAEVKAMGAEVLAEGVETKEQAVTMAQAGASLAQGWLFGRPVPCAAAHG